jgi:hypothetical protein
LRKAALVPELHREPDHGLPVAMEERGYRRGVDAARHRHSDEIAVRHGKFLETR